MTPVEDEPEVAHGLTTRAELVEKIRVLGQDVLDGVNFGFDNVVDQLKVLNPTVEDEEEDEQEDDEKGQEEEGHGESDS
ncbi:hypothetical protein A2U01_0078450 [Trifolium medium]|uniref:Uncharacterized protein n=1 Tax=Trifolium medium TaxID=97028 RepID=A0A392T841_9FABA|nr:hypothetical protein [Trifolium medium]